MPRASATKVHARILSCVATTSLDQVETTVAVDILDKMGLLDTRIKTKVGLHPQWVIDHTKGPIANAIFAVNNFLSFGALNAVKAQGLRIPADISIAGFDDLPEAMVNFPFLSVVAQPAYELGAMAARRLFERILNPAMDTREIVLSTTFRERSSTGPAPIR